jgi:hypothetical protein
MYIKKVPPNLGISKKKNISAGHKTKRELMSSNTKTSLQ